MQKIIPDYLDDKWFFLPPPGKLVLLNCESQEFGS